MNKDITLTAPCMDRLLLAFDRGYLNPSYPSETVQKAIAPLYDILKDLAPLKKNNEVKTIWLKIPRGEMPEFDSFEELKEYGEVETYDEYVEAYEEYVERWNEDYPDEFVWYELIISEGFKKDGELWFRSVSVEDKHIVNAGFDMKESGVFGNSFLDEFVEQICELLCQAAEESMGRLRRGEYNDDVEKNLPYQFRTGVIKRIILLANDPERKNYDFEEVDKDYLKKFKELVESGKNDVKEIGRMKSMTANDFFKACSIGYHACKYDKIFDKDGKELPLSEQYLRVGDGRDEGLTGNGSGINDGEGIDFDDPKAWDEWYFDRKRSGGHPWEVVAGGNSTHVDLFVCHDKQDLEWQVRLGKISQEEYDAIEKGYYFMVAGLHRGPEAVAFYVALHDAGYPVVINDAEELLARFEETDYVGIVPHTVFPRYCESMFPRKYGKVVDFIHVYEEDIDLFGDQIEWLPEEKATLISISK